MSRVAILVAGMHRSGTSVLARVLSALGCDAPKTLMAADAHNPTGYWESTKIAALNDEILVSAGSSWNSWERFNQDWYSSPVVGDFRERALAALDDEFADSPLFVLKDPRICRLTAFWLDAINNFGAVPHVVVPLRNPLEVADSLTVRDAIDRSVGMLMWLRNVLDAEFDSRGCPRAFLHYQDLLENWQETMAGVGRDLGIAWPRRSATTTLEIDDYLSPALRHHCAGDALAGDAAPWVATTYGVLQRWAVGETHDADVKQLDGVNAMLTAATPAFAQPLVAGLKASQSNRDLQTEIGELRKIVAARDNHIGSLDQAVRDRDREISALVDTVAAKDRQIANLDKVIADRDVKLDAQAHVIAGRDGEISTLLDTVAARDEAVAAGDKLRAERDGQIDSLERALHDQEERVRILHRSTSWRITAPLRWFKETGITSVRLPLRFLALIIARSVQRLWRLVPLRWRASLLGFLPTSMAITLRTTLRVGSRDRPDLTYVPSSRIDLADLNSEAFRNQHPVPILFDADYYLENNKDIADAGIDPLAHYMEHGAIEGRLPIDINPEEIDPLVLELHRFDLDHAVSSAFDPGFYRALHPDLASFDDDALADHYQRHGKVEGRPGSKTEFLQQVAHNPREIPIDFRAAEYIELYPDLQHYADEHPLAALRHYMRFGRREPRLHTLRSDAKHMVRSSAVDLNLQKFELAQSRPLCVLAHVYYPELWDELSTYLANLPSEIYDLYVNLVDTTFEHDLLARVRQDFPQARVYISENIGRDIGGHFRVLRSVRMADYRLFCLVHTKKSPHMSKGEVQIWRRKLLMPLMGSQEIAADNIRLFLADDHIGQLGSGRCRYRELDDNPKKYFELLERLGIDEDEQQVEFLSGTMMFLRREVLQRLIDATHDVELEHGDGRCESYHRDGQWAHAIERAIGAVVRDMNLRSEWR